MSLGNEDRKFIFGKSELTVRITDYMGNSKPILFSLQDFLNMSEKELLDMQNFLNKNWKEIMEDIDLSFSEYYFWETLWCKNYHSWRDILERYEETIKKIIIKLDENSDEYKVCYNLLNKRDPYSNIEITYSNKNREKIKEKQGYIYILYIEKLDVYKIGKTMDMTARMDTFGVKFPADFVVLHSYKSDNYDAEEARLHKMFKHKLAKERSEWFNLDKNDLDYLFSLGGGGFV